MRHFVKDYIDSCATCQSTKNLTNCPSTLLQPILPETDATPFSTVSMDFIIELPTSCRYDAIAVFVDHDVTKAAVFTPAPQPSPLIKPPPSIAIMFGNASASPKSSYLIVVPSSL